MLPYRPGYRPGSPSGVRPGAHPGSRSGPAPRRRADSAARPTGTADGATVVALRGDIDLGTAAALTARLDAVTAGAEPDVILDLRAMTFIDCSGLGLLCRVRNRVVERHGRLRLVTDSPRFLRVLRQAGLAGLFDVRPHPPAPHAPSPGSPSPDAPPGAVSATAR
ncbi:STAS domain-containing protein [Streptomyces sp. G45]|uniref:STAS domain-containing protein n=1 Tax=Streptomyces sp. G45 TaxID=3406627 RepID=UPI003C2597E3